MVLNERYLNFNETQKEAQTIFMEAKLWIQDELL
jgi:hypothetical protein